ncbi:YihY family inner membrane protein [bacterium]|nr:YihY family inner membrane protein [bacterium]
MLATKINAIRHYFTVDLWKPQPQEKRLKKAAVSAMRTLLIATRGFIDNKNSLKASALTFYAVLSIVPVFAVAFGIAQGFGFEDKLEAQIRESFAGQEEVMNRIIEFSRTSLNNVSGGLVAGISILFLLWSVIKLLNHIENAFNAIWNLRKSRSFIRKFTDYLTLMLLGPIFILLSGSVTVFINTEINSLDSGSYLLEVTSTFILSLMQLAPYVLVWILFTFLYMVIPNKNVKFLPALAGGIIAGSAFAFLQNGYVYFQLAMSRYNAIYGSFAALPLFLIWMQISWLIILFGAEISYAAQYSSRLLHARQSKKLSHRATKIISMQVLRKIADNFKKGATAQSLNELAEELNYPVNFIEKAIANLLNAGLISTVVKENGSKKKVFQPALSVDQLTFTTVLHRLDRTGFNDLVLEKPDDLRMIESHLEKIEQSLEQDHYNVPITSLQF